MKENRYLTLLRGINVGGNNIIRMSDLKSCFENMGFTGVSTHIQSGNVIFTSTESDKTSLTERIEKSLTERFRYLSRIVLVSHLQLKEVIEKSPPGFGNSPEKYRYDVMFLKETLIPGEVIKQISLKEGVDTVHTGPGVLYFSRLISRATQSRLSRIVTLPVYQFITIRNWNTTTKLLALMES